MKRPFFRSSGAARGALLIVLAVGALPTIALATDLPPCGPEANGNVVSTSTVATPLAGSESEAEIGQSMISAVRLDDLATGIRVLEPFSASGKYVGAAFQVQVPAGDYPILKGSTGGAVDVPNAVFKYDRERKPRRGFGAPSVIMHIAPSNVADIEVIVIFGIPQQTAIAEHPPFKPMACTRVDKPSFRRELVYSGASKGTIKLLYREFSNDLARPAFSQDLTYDLADGDEIGFRGARFKVLKATNTSIRYVVLKPLNEN